MATKKRTYRNILLPVDGSAPSRRGVREALRLAGQLKARVTAVHVVTPFEAYVYAEGLPAVMTVAEFEKRARRRAAAILDRVERACRASRIPCRTCTVWDTRAADALVRTARLQRCDLIVMGSHGRHGMDRVLMGSVTRAVVAGSPIPVVVCR